jgi:hypothetical protein
MIVSRTDVAPTYAPPPQPPAPVDLSPQKRKGSLKARPPPIMIGTSSHSAFLSPLLERPFLIRFGGKQKDAVEQGKGKKENEREKEKEKEKDKEKEKEREREKDKERTLVKSKSKKGKTDSICVDPRANLLDVSFAFFLDSVVGTGD